MDKRDNRTRIDSKTLTAIYSSLTKDDADKITQFLQDSWDEINDVYRGICCNGTNQFENKWGSCVNEESCITHLRRKVEERNDIDQNSKKKKKKRRSNLRQKVEICKCNFNPVSHFVFYIYFKMFDHFFSQVFSIYFSTAMFDISRWFNECSIKSQ